MLAFAPAAALLAISLALPKHSFLSVFGMNVPRSQVTYAREGITGTVTIHETPSSVQGAPPLRVLSINGADVAGTSLMLRTTQKLQAHIPLLLHADPRQVLQVGLGSGETAHAILMHPIERLVGCDISPEVIEAGKHFEDINRDVYDDPRLEIVIDDAKNYIACTERTFDLILNDSVHPVPRQRGPVRARVFRGLPLEAPRGGHDVVVVPDRHARGRRPAHAPAHVPRRVSDFDGVAGDERRHAQRVAAGLEG